MHNIPRSLDEEEIRSFCDPFGGVRNLFLLKDERERFLGHAVVEYGLVDVNGIIIINLINLINLIANCNFDD